MDFNEVDLSSRRERGATIGHVMGVAVAGACILPWDWLQPNLPRGSRRDSEALQ